MRIDPRYFNKFMVVVAIVAAILIAFTTLNYISGREAKFQQQMMEADSLGYVSFPRFDRPDSVQLRQYRGQYLLVDFWSTISEPSLASHKALVQLPAKTLDTLSVVAASVRMDSSGALGYQKKYGYPFTFVDGTEFYQRMNLPGIPSQIFIDPHGKVLATFVGYTDSTRYDSLQTLIHE